MYVNPIAWRRRVWSNYISPPLPLLARVLSLSPERLTTNRIAVSSPIYLI